MSILLSVTESAREKPPVVVRRARTSDVPAIKHLVDTYAGKILLEKNLVTLYEAVQEFWVAELVGRLRRVARLLVGSRRDPHHRGRPRGDGPRHRARDRLAAARGRARAAVGA